MRRQVFEKLKAWKTNPDRKSLILRGARQAGKTWVLKDFGRREFLNTAYLNCEKNESAKTLFQDDFDVQRLIRGISALTRVDIQPETTLIVLDEIQEVPRAIQ
ncbi:MAG: AAA family ATPase [Solobacterium sp.]|nr:AAA family ATPase [Solobacterium sp.]